MIYCTSVPAIQPSPVREHTVTRADQQRTSEGEEQATHDLAAEHNVQRAQPARGGLLLQVGWQHMDVLCQGEDLRNRLPVHGRVSE